MQIKSILALVIAMIAMISHDAYADNAKDHDRARQALESGQILPLKKILENIETSYPGQVLEVELEHKQDRWIYEIKILQKDHLRIKLKINAVDGTILSDQRK